MKHVSHRKGVQCLACRAGRPPKAVRATVHVHRKGVSCEKCKAARSPKPPKVVRVKRQRMRARPCVGSTFTDIDVETLRQLLAFARMHAYPQTAAVVKLTQKTQRLRMILVSRRGAA